MVTGKGFGMRLGVLGCFMCVSGAAFGGDDFLRPDVSSGGALDLRGQTALSFGYSAAEGASAGLRFEGSGSGPVVFGGSAFLSESSGRVVGGLTRVLEGGSALRVRAGYLESGFESDATFGERVGGFAVGYEVDAGLGRVQLRYSYSRTEFDDYSGGSAAITRAVGRDFDAHRLGYVYGLSDFGDYGRYGVQFSQDVGGLDGDSYVVTRFGAEGVRVLSGPWRLEGSFEGAALSGSSDASSLATRFFGGGLVRGVDMTTAGPEQSGDAIGGERMVGASAELWRDVEGVRFGDMSIGAFLDAGAVWSVSGVDDANLSGSGDYEARVSGGLLLGWQFERGRLEVALSEPISTQAGDETHVLEVGFRSAF